MSPHDNTFMAWGFGLVGFAYLAFALTLLRIGAGRVSASRSGKVLFGAVCCSSAWGWLTLSSVLRESEMLGFIASLVDVGRYGLWLTFLLLPQVTFWPMLTIVFGTAMACLGALLFKKRSAA